MRFALHKRHLAIAAVLAMLGAGYALAQSVQGLDLGAIERRKDGEAAEAEAFARDVARRGDTVRDDALATVRGGEANLRGNAQALQGGPQGPIDFDAILKQAAGNGEGQGQAPLFIVFASLSMPAESLKPLIRDTARAGGAVVFQGFPGNSMKAFQQGILRVVERGQDAANVGIDPRLFRAFHVESVPTFVVASSDFDLCSGFQCETAPPAHDRMSGNVTVEYALETIAEGKGPGARVAGQALQHLREGQGS